MKRHGNLWSRITDLENIKLAHRYARRGKSFYTEVKMVNQDVDKYAKEIQKLLIEKTFTTSQYEVSERSDGKKLRTVYKLPYYPDRIVQHALLNVTGPLLTKSMIRDTFQSIIGRGTADAARRVKKIVRSENCPKYALKVDIEKYYPSIQNDKMKEIVRRYIKCNDTLWLFDDIIDSTQGLPIGNYTSQHLGNLYLNQFDWWVKQQIKPSGYFRYCDDIVIFGNDKKELKDTKKLIQERLNLLGLKIKPSWMIYDVQKQGVDFVGYVFKPNITRLRPSIARKFRAACKNVYRAIPMLKWQHSLSALMSYKGWILPCNGKQLWRRHVKSALVNWFPKQLRGSI